MNSNHRSVRLSSKRRPSSSSSLPLQSPNKRRYKAQARTRPPTKSTPAYNLLQLPIPALEKLHLFLDVSSLQRVSETGRKLRGWRRDRHPRTRMGHPWSETAEAFVLSQLRQTVNFWKLGRSASFSLEASDEGSANLVTKFQLPQPSEHLPTLSPQFPFPSKTQPQHKPGNQVPIPSKTPGIPPLFPFGGSY